MGAVAPGRRLRRVGVSKTQNRQHPMDPTLGPRSPAAKREEPIKKDDPQKLKQPHIGMNPMETYLPYRCNGARHTWSRAFSMGSVPSARTLRR